MKPAIVSVGAYAPVRKMDNTELSTIVETSDEWIRSHTGIGSRHIAADDEAASDLAVKASRIALERAGIDASELDLIVVATATPDYNGFPSTGCLVQDALGASRAAAFDLAAGCSGFVYALDTASAMLQTQGRKHALVIGSEVFSRIVDWKDRNTCVLFGDGAGAVVLSNIEGDRGVLRSILRSDGSGGMSLVIRDGGSRNPVCTGSSCDGGPHVEMDGRKVYTFAVQVTTDLITELLESEGLSIGDIAAIVPHQANQRIISAAAKRLGISEDLFFMNIEEYANTSAASIPLALNEMFELGRLKKGDLIMTLGFGAGLTWGGNIIRW